MRIREEGNQTIWCGRIIKFLSEVEVSEKLESEAETPDNSFS